MDESCLSYGWVMCDRRRTMRYGVWSQTCKTRTRASKSRRNSLLRPTTAASVCCRVCCRVCCSVCCIVLHCVLHSMVQSRFLLALKRVLETLYPRRRPQQVCVAVCVAVYVAVCCNQDPYSRFKESSKLTTTADDCNQGVLQ